MHCRYCGSEKTYKRKAEIQMQRLRKEFFGNRRTEQTNYNREKSAGGDVVYVFESVVQLSGEEDISLFADNDNELGKESVSRSKNA